MSRFRVIVRIDDAGMAAHIGGAVKTTFKTVEFDCPALAAVLGEEGPANPYCHSFIVGVERISPAGEKEAERG